MTRHSQTKVPIQLVLKTLRTLGFNPKNSLQAVKMFDGILRAYKTQGECVRAKPVFYAEARGKGRVFLKHVIPAWKRPIAYVVLE